VLLITDLSSKINLFNITCYSVTGIWYRVIHKSLWDFRPLRYSSRDGHAEGELMSIL
jgi:hypothetical protein